MNCKMKKGIISFILMLSVMLMLVPLNILAAEEAYVKEGDLTFYLATQQVIKCDQIGRAHV